MQLKKPRSDKFPKIKKLTPDQRAFLDDLLLDQNLGYEQTRERFIDKYGITLSTGTLGNYYRAEKTQRVLEANAIEHLLDIEVAPSKNHKGGVRISILENAAANFKVSRFEVEGRKQLIRIGR